MIATKCARLMLISNALSVGVRLLRFGGLADFLLHQFCFSKSLLCFQMNSTNSGHSNKQQTFCLL